MGAAGRPWRDGAAFLVEEDVSAPGAELPLWQEVHIAVIIAVPLSVYRVPAVCCSNTHAHVYILIHTQNTLHFLTHTHVQYIHTHTSTYAFTHTYSTHTPGSNAGPF